MGKDVVADRYARLYEIPFQLARLGHSVLGICLSYHGDEAGAWQHDASPGELRWISRSLGGLLVPALLSHVRQATHEIHTFAPNLLIGASDIPHVAFTAWLAKRLALPYAIDLYDNFEGFGQARIPGFVTLLRRAVREADLVTTTSEPLAELVRKGYRAQGRVISMPSTVDKAIFRPQDRAACRQQLGLPQDARLIGTAGGLHKDKGVGTLYAAWNALAARRNDVHLVLAGPMDPAFPPPASPRVHYLGQIPHAQTATLFSALDTGVIYVRETAFGRYCFPQKAYEMLACGIPIVAARVGAMQHLFADQPTSLYRPDDAGDLAQKLTQQLEKPSVCKVSIRDWTAIIADLEPELIRISDAGRRSRGQPSSR